MAALATGRGDHRGVDAMGIFKRKNPADAAAEEWMDDWERARARAESLDDEGLVEMVRESGTRPMHRLEAASRLGARGRLDLLKALLASGETASQLGGIDGACTAACNGQDGAVELLADLPRHPDRDLRFRAVECLAMVADGTPGDLGSSTREIRQAAHSILERFRKDSDDRIMYAASIGVGSGRVVDDVRRGPDQLTYLGRRVSEELIAMAKDLPRS